MKAPDKIYVVPNFNRRWFTKTFDDESTEYLRKDALLEWLREQIVFCDAIAKKHDISCISERFAFKHVIDKINSL